MDCSFVGPIAGLCKEAALEWSKLKKVSIRIETQDLTSTEKLRRYKKMLQSKKPGPELLDVLSVDVIWPGVLHEYLLDLDPYFKGPVLERYLKIYLENNTVNGRLLALPLKLDVGLLFYRKDLLEKYKLPLPQTWEQLQEAALKIQAQERAAGDAKFWGFVFQGKAYEGLTCNALEWIGSYQGGSLIDARGKVYTNTSNVLVAMTQAASWIKKIAPPEVLKYAERESHEAFRSGHAAFLRAWPSAWAVVNEGDSPVQGKIGVALIPKGGEKGLHASVLGGWSLAVSKQSKNPALAADFLQFLTSPEQQKKRALLAGAGPTMLSLYQDPEILKSAPYHEILIPILSQAVLRPSRITRQFYPDVSRELWLTTHSILSGKTSAIRAISDLQNRLDALSKNWKNPSIPD